MAITFLTYEGCMRTQLLDIPRAAEQLRVAQKTLYKWVEAGQVPFVRMGGRVGFRPEDLERGGAGRVGGAGEEIRLKATGPRLR